MAGFNIQHTPRGNYDASVKTPFAHIGLRFDAEKLVTVDFINAKKEIKAETAVAKRACKKIRDYCDGKLDISELDMPIETHGTPFQEKVWRALRQIPPGKVLTYGALAKKLNTSPRAVGNACRSNPVPLVVPCHRVVSATGIGGYSGTTHGRIHNIKHWLLEREGAL